ncbi:amino acid ABC transporter permease [Terrihabitans rhizophilus]|uniref:Amino acid ABC transporter permease n=1 Tax=Terrihabitans rhizophilus TaxID=3092662 RepID=A0ABU4RIN0_9HYPH|nr:amino acid ABC transporter permease [Terrihabitans sp. PJ23]MDX6804692.1 amino acid ABC transporter permease [Terrihabitans sp. PJ23]
MTAGAFISLLQGAGMTLFISGAGIVLGVPLGLVLALVRWGRVPVLGKIVAVYVSLLRSVPAVTLILLIFFAVPTIGPEIGPITAAIVMLTLNTAAFNCEIWRAGLNNFPADQLEASRAFGMTPLLRFRRIIFPQLWRSSLPPLINEMTMLIKSSPAIAVVGVVEITRAATRIGAQTYDPLPPMIVATVLYVLVIMLFVGLQRITERRYGQIGAEA